MTDHSQLPRLSRVDFFRFKEDELVSALREQSTAISAKIPMRK